MSDGFFALRASPRRVAVIGGGYVAVELAGVLRALGAEVSVFVRGERLLAGFDQEITAELSIASAKVSPSARSRRAAMIGTT